MKSKNLIGLAQQIIDQHRGEVPTAAKRWKPYPESAAKPRASFSTWCSARTKLPSTRTYFVLPTARVGAGKDAARRRGRTRGHDAKGIHEGRPSLAPSARALRVRRARSRVPKVHYADLCEYPDKTPAKKLEKSDAPIVRRVGPRPSAGRDRTIAARKRRPRAAGKLI